MQQTNEGGFRTHRKPVWAFLSHHSVASRITLQTQTGIIGTVAVSVVNISHLEPMAFLYLLAV